MGRSEILDVVELSWSYGPVLSEARGGHVHVALSNGKVLVAGGNSRVGYRDTAEIFDAIDSVRTLEDRLAVPTHLFTGTSLDEGRALLTGGLYGTGAYMTELAYLFRDGVLGRTGGMKHFRAVHSAVALRDGRVLVTGGFESSSVEVFDPETETFSDAAPLAADRYGHSSVLLNDGRVLVIGNAEGPNLRSTETYDPDRDAWVAGASLNASHALAGAVVLSDGAVVVAGGCGEEAGTVACNGVVERIEIEWLE